MAQQRIIVVGGGVMGLATGCALAARPDIEVTVLERFQVGHDWASSHGLTRAIRHEYGANRIYTQMVARSLTLWDELARETGRALYTETGVLTLGQEGDGQRSGDIEPRRLGRPGQEERRGHDRHPERRQLQGGRSVKSARAEQQGGDGQYGAQAHGPGQPG